MAIQCTSVLLYHESEQVGPGQSKLTKSVRGVTFTRAKVGRMRKLTPFYVALVLCGGKPGPFTISIAITGPESQSNMPGQTYEWPDSRWSFDLIMKLEPEIEFVESAVYTISFLVDMTPLVNIGLPLIWDDDPNPINPTVLP